MGKLIVNYVGNGGIVVPDDNIMRYVEETINKAKNYDILEIFVGSEMIIDGFRVAVVEGLIDRHFIVFKYGHEEIKIDHQGNLSNYPPGFLETHNNLLFRLIKFRADARTAANKKKGEGS